MTAVHPFIDGRTVECENTYPNIDPSTGEQLCRVGRGGRSEIDHAVIASRRAQPGWYATPPADRARILTRLADLIEGNLERLAVLESEDTGKPLTQARIDAEVCARYFRFYGHCVDSYYGLSIPLNQAMHVYTRREPFGVVGSIVAWNYPMQLLARAVAPAVATGNAIIVKPADETPRTAVALAEIALDAGIPPGLFNVVTGLGAEAGSALAGHPGVAHINFVGSNAVGKLVAQATAERVTPTVLELGGKSPHIVFPDADLDHAADVIARAILQNAGQTCSAGSRVLIHASIQQDFVHALAERLARVRLGRGVDDPDLGPLVSRKQQERVAAMVDTAHGGRVVVGGNVPVSEKLRSGSYFEPTLIDGVSPTSLIAQEEVFGPVLVSMPFADEGEAIALANGTDYALMAAIWTRDLSRAHTVAAAVQAGQVYVNAYGAGGGVELPFGGFKQSGYGREKGVEAMDAYTQTKTVIVRIG